MLTVWKIMEFNAENSSFNLSLRAPVNGIELTWDYRKGAWQSAVIFPLPQSEGLFYSLTSQPSCCGFRGIFLFLQVLGVWV